jgi:hypothetical protein
MHEEFIRQQIASGAARDEQRADRLIADIAGAYWPGGAADQPHPVALDWLRHWRPATSCAALPACSCTRGRCAICN